jgi:hypothetical protein
MDVTNGVFHARPPLALSASCSHAVTTSTTA